MRLKTYTAPTLPEAMAEVRAALGREAVILATEADGRGGVRVTAGLEAAPCAPAPAPPADLEALAEALDDHGVPAGLAERLLAAAGARLGGVGAAPPVSQVDVLAAALAAELAFAPPPDGPGGGPWLLVGPPGAGKTATAAKLAARARLGGRAAALVTMDSEKSGGRAQIAAFAEALEVPLAEAADAAALSEAVARATADALVLVDAPGTSPFDAGAGATLAGFTAAAGARPLAVLPAGGDALETAEAALAYAELGARHMVASKLDAARRLGGIVNAAHTAALALVGGGVAPTIGDGLAALDAPALARLLLQREVEASTAERPAAGVQA